MAEIIKGNHLDTTHMIQTIAALAFVSGCMVLFFLHFVLEIETMPLVLTVPAYAIFWTTASIITICGLFEETPKSTQECFVSGLKKSSRWVRFAIPMLVGSFTPLFVLIVLVVCVLVLLVILFDGLKSLYTIGV